MFARFRFLVPALLVLSAPVAGALIQEVPQTSSAARAAWGFGRSDLAPHPRVRFGVLPNGMRYALMKNNDPAGSVSVRLHVGAGSTAEGAREQGYMHLVEHMIFHGSTNIPEGALPMMLSHAGLRRWTDFHAFTSFDETLFNLDLAKSDAHARRTALALMREISGRLLFGSKGVEGAKRMVREEIAARDKLQDRIMAAQNTFFFPGSAIAGSSVASTEASVKRAKGKVLQRLYQTHYTPQRTTLIMVGGFDPQAAEAEVAATFSDWSAGNSEVPAERVTHRVQRQEAAFKLFVHPDAETGITLAVAEPAGGGDAAKQRDSQFLEQLGTQMFNRRLARIAGAPDAAFLNPDSTIYDHFSAGRLARLDLGASNRDWRRALAAGEAELQRAIDEGFSQVEFGEQLELTRQSLAKLSAPRTNKALADALADAVGRDLVFTQPGNGSATQAYLKRVQLVDVNAAFKAAWSSSRRLVFVTHNRSFAEPEATIAEALASADHSPGL